jgi:N-acyl-L-homoserine lactone synthetase
MMLRYLYAKELDAFPRLQKSMFCDRAEQFVHRLNWDVSVNGMGEERDEYDDLNPLYVIWENADGLHGGSMRFLPTLGPTMVADHFAHLTGGVTIASPLIWECTRFCLAPGAGRNVSAALVLGAGELMHGFYLSHFLGVFDPRMERIYRMLGLEPDVIGRTGAGSDEIGVGLWEMQASAWPRVLRRVGVSREVSRRWFRASFTATARPYDLAMKLA